MNQDNKNRDQGQDLKGHAGQGGQTQFRASERQGEGQDSGLTGEHRSFQGEDSDPAEGARGGETQASSGQRGTEGGETTAGDRPGVGDDRRGRDSQAETSNT